ncbi:unnamed protein product [Chironomus riparius]|uniref:Chibby n=1 Tax=Chironomus riparius TaxID=315576 RepID=A0A9N9RL00_9DIPT|nr:unnamed protein product [Chironomus riparius]
MPIFPQRKLTFKHPKQRELRLNSVAKYNEDIDDFKNIKIKLSNERELQFVDGEWISINKSQQEEFDDTARLVRENKRLENENSTLNVKMDIMLDLLTECISEKEAIAKK